MPRSATAKKSEPIDDLTQPQILALESLLAGETISEAARAAKRDRCTVSRWRRDDTAFQAAFNERRQALWEAAEARLLRVASDAAGVVEREVSSGGLRASLAVLKGLGLLSPDRPNFGAFTAEELRERELDRGAGAAVREAVNQTLGDE